MQINYPLVLQRTVSLELAKTRTTGLYELPPDPFCGLNDLGFDREFCVSCIYFPLGGSICGPVGIYSFPQTNKAWGLAMLSTNLSTGGEQ